MNAYRTMYRDILRGAALAVAIGAVFTVALAGVATLAGAATVARAVTPARSACTAFARWQQHGTQAGLDRLVTASLPLGRSWLKADIGQLYADASSPSAKAGKYVRTDRKYVAEDCSKL